MSMNRMGGFACPNCPAGPRDMVVFSIMRLTLALVFASLVWAQRPDLRDDRRNPLENQPAAIASGATLFAGACSGCHGATGEGGRGPNLRDGRAVRRQSDQQLFTSILKGVPGTDMPPVSLPEEKIWQLVAYVRSLSSPAFEMPLPGDPQKGAALFFGKATCAGCHMIEGRGGFLGPDLSNAGARTAVLLRESVLNPSARIADGFQGVTATLANGQKISGVAKSNTNYAIQILDANGKLHLLSKSDVQEVAYHKASLMPGDFPSRLAKDEMNDLLAYLSRQTVRPPAPRSDARRRDMRK